MANLSEHDSSAPDALRIIEELINTRGLVFNTETLGIPAELAEWLTARGLLPEDATVDSTDLDRARRLREGLRALLTRNNAEHFAGEQAAADIAELAAVLHDLPLVLDVTANPPALRAQTGSPVERALATIVSGIPQAVADGTWNRLKVCRKASCRFAYYDNSRNRARAWCSMQTCGNQAKVRAFRQRSARLESAVD